MKKITNTMLKINTFIFLLCLANFSFSQSYLKLISEGSGLEQNPRQSELESAASELIQAFPIEYQNLFKVFDFSFYSQNGFMQGGFGAVWNDIVISP